jgi:hypothetical protein
MSLRPSISTKKDENKIEVITMADDIMDLCDKLDSQNSASLSMDYADDEPRKKAIQGIDDLHRGLYGAVSERQHAQLTFILQQITEQEKLDRENDKSKHSERSFISQIKHKAKELRNEYRAR